MKYIGYTCYISLYRSFQQKHVFTDPAKEGRVALQVFSIIFVKCTPYVYNTYSDRDKSWPIFLGES